MASEVHSPSILRIRKEKIEKIALDEAREIYEDKKLRREFVVLFTSEFNRLMRLNLGGEKLLECQIEDLKDKKRKAIDLVIDNPELADSVAGRIKELESQLKRKEKGLEHMRRSLLKTKVTEEQASSFLNSVFARDLGIEAILQSMVCLIAVDGKGKIEIVFNVMDPDKENASPEDEDAYKRLMVTQPGIEPGIQP